MNDYVLTLKDFAHSFGVMVNDIPIECKHFIKNTDFRYRIIQNKERDDIILDVLKKIESDKQVIGAKERKNVWENGWSENLHEFIDNNFDINKITPKFIKKGQPIRFNKQYIVSLGNPNFELDYFKVFRIWLFKEYMENFDNIYDFGCGTGFNLVTLAQMYPNKKLHGLDFVDSSKLIVNKIRDVYKLKMEGYIFDMINPDYNFNIEKNSVIFTSGSIEQLSGKFESFLQFILKKSPELCVHIEPTIELYDENNLIDYLAIKFHKKRGYTENYLSRLIELEKQRLIKIIKVKRLFFGGLYMEGFTYIIWKPLHI